ncbi:hypothetical protein FHS87_002139 [Roseomonas pecuniae]|uniref:Uncharacterized protein n=1 Tax=Muricoccus pecuniae TaxID=693023 RepID=A0A840Y5P5_9PROT|nr:hypothetical protein [Roseomonas pecuniae]
MGAVERGMRGLAAYARLGMPSGLVPVGASREPGRSRP